MKALALSIGLSLLLVTYGLVCLSLGYLAGTNRPLPAPLCAVGESGVVDGSEVWEGVGGDGAPCYTVTHAPPADIESRAKQSTQKGI